MKCSKDEFDRFVSKQIEDYTEDGETVRPMSIDETDSFLSVMVDLVWPDMPTGFTAEEFMESWNRQVNEMTAHD